MKFIGLKHRADGIFGYQLQDGTYRAVLQAPSGLYSNVKIVWDDPYNWGKVGQEYKWKCTHEDSFFKKETDALYDYFSFNLNSREQRFKYFFVFDFNNKRYAYGEFGLREYYGSSDDYNYHGFAFTWNYSSVGKYVGPKKWWNEISWYQIFPDRFASSDKPVKRNTNDYDEHMGGNLKGIIQKLDYIQELGFNGIYLNPIFKAVSAHKYDTEDYFAIDPDFGTMADFEMLLQQLKKRNMKIMLDGVFNHCGFTFMQWQDVLKNRSKSKYKDWFIIWNMDEIGPPEKFENTDFMISGKSKSFSTFGNTPTMPRLNWANKEVQEFICQVIEFWTKKGIDAWRMDVADEVSFDMWRQVRETFYNINEEGMLLGEIWYDSMLFLHGDQFDTTMNYPFRNNAFNYFVNKNVNEKEFVESIIEHKYRYPETINKGLFNLLSSHDTPRIFDELNQDEVKTRLALGWLLLSDGVISFYYGDELNLVGQSKRFNREPFNWEFDKQDKTFNFVKSMMHIRNQNIKIFNLDYQVSYDLDKQHIFLNYLSENAKFKIIFDCKLNTININGQLFDLN